MAHRHSSSRRAFPTAIVSVTVLAVTGLALYLSGLLPSILSLQPAEASVTLETIVPVVVEPTAQPVEPEIYTELINPTAAPSVPAIVPGEFSSEAYASLLEQGIFDEMLGRRVRRVFIIDGRPQGESRTAIISYPVDNKTALSDQDDWVSMFRVVGSIVSRNGLELDVVTLMPIISGGSGSAVITTTAQMLADYIEGSINRSEFFASLEISAF